MENLILRDYPNFNKISISYSHKGNYFVCVTFFTNNTYQMLFGRVQELNYESVSELIRNHHYKPKNCTINLSSLL